MVRTGRQATGKAGSIPARRTVKIDINAPQLQKILSFLARTMATVDCMFYVPIVKIDVLDWEEKKKKLKKIYEKHQEQMEYPSKDFVQTNYYKDNTSLIPEVSKILELEISLFFQQLSISSGVIDAVWFEQARKGDWHQPHNHGPLGYSCVCFMEFCEKDHTATHFLSPFSNFLTGELFTYVPKVKEGTIIFFPSYTLHFTKPNLTEKERLILSFNLSCQP